MQTIQFEDEQSVYLVENAITRECSLIQSGIGITQRNLESFETKYRMTSEEFYEKYQKGEADDDLEIMQWAAEFQALGKLTGDYQKLREVRIVS
ncbi:MAG: hypothetical protein DRI57_07480 [Deltaproteobacteria bacterium]|nr:MAG: hypothetical protein DRI57_07480 [Deltaproteobacteria bacterium]